MDGNTLITHLYAAFNARDINNALALMSDNVSWPKASEGGRAEGKDAIRAYWSRQWSEFDPHVEPLEVLEEGDCRTRVRVHQRVKTLAGAVLFDGEVSHVYTIAQGLVERMDVARDGNDDEAVPSAAFARKAD